LVEATPQYSQVYEASTVPGLQRCFFSVVVLPQVLQVYNFLAEDFLEPDFFVVFFAVTIAFLLVVNDGADRCHG